jgi:hypothetical protein
MADQNYDSQTKNMVEEAMLKAMSRSEAGRAAANARWAGHSGGSSSGVSDLRARADKIARLRDRHAKATGAEKKKLYGQIRSLERQQRGGGADDQRNDRGKLSSDQKKTYDQAVLDGATHAAAIREAKAGVASSGGSKREQDLSSLTPGQKKKYDAYMALSAGSGKKETRTSQQVHDDALRTALDPKSPRPPKISSTSNSVSGFSSQEKSLMNALPSDQRKAVAGMSVADQRNYLAGRLLGGSHESSMSKAPSAVGGSQFKGPVKGIDLLGNTMRTGKKK